MNELALFAGAGGGILGTHLLGFNPVCAVEFDPYAREVLLRRQEDRILPPFPIWDDVRSFDGICWRGIVDVVSAGFPCQPFSSAGSKRDERDHRNLWPDTIRIIRELGPKQCLLENVPRLLSIPYFGRIIGDLTEAGYDARWGVVSAAQVGAPHVRKRLWILANSKHDRIPQRWRTEDACGHDGSGRVRPDERSVIHEKEASFLASCGKAISNSDSTGLEKQCRTKPDEAEHTSAKLGGWWKIEPEVGRVANGVACRVDQLKALGNGQVPAVVRNAWRYLKCQ